MLHNHKGSFASLQIPKKLDPHQGTKLRRIDCWTFVQLPTPEF